MAASPQHVQKGKGKRVSWLQAEGEKRQPIGSRTIAQEGVRMVQLPCKQLRTSALCPVWSHRDLRVSHGQACVCRVRHHPGTHH